MKERIKIKSKICGLCKIEKEINEFSKDKYNKSGYTKRCKECRNIKSTIWVVNNPDKIIASNLKHKERRKEYYSDIARKFKYRKKYIERTFKIEYSEYEKMQIEQNNVCFICSKPEMSNNRKYLCVDHCHTTGKIRGLLCSTCNRGIGYLQDNPILLENAKNYLLLRG